MSSSQCKHCQSSGLAILPVRYAPAPWRTAVIPTLPEWADDPAGPIGFSDPKQREPALSALGNEFKYTLRILRAGYLYLYYEKRHITSVGEVQWLCYTVFDDGSVFPSQPDDAAPPAEHPACDSSAHLGALLRQVIVMEPHKSPPVWIAFSEHRWTEATRNRYAQDVALRQKRMQCIDPKALLKSPKGPRLTAAPPGNLQHILEYKPGVTHDTLPFAEKVPTLSTGEGGAYDSDRLKTVSTRYKLAVRAGDAFNEPQLMRSRTEDENGHSKAGIILALHDAVGMVHELNGFRGDAAGWVAKYGKERELQISALALIDGAKAALAKRTSQLAQQHVNRINQAPDPLDVRETRAKIGLQRDPGDAYWQKELADIQSERQHKLVVGTEGAGSYETAQLAGSWLPYEDNLKPGAVDTFKEHWDGLSAKAHDLMEGRSKPLLAWIESKLFLTALEDYDSTDLADGVCFENVVGDALYGLGSCKASAQKISAWVNEAIHRITSENVLFRAIALNHDEGKAAVQQALAAASAHTNTPLTEQALVAAEGSTKYIAKLAELSKKGLTLHSQLNKAGVKRIPTGGLEKILMSVGDRFFVPFMRKGIDNLAEKLVVGMLMARTGYGHAATMGLFIAEARHVKEGRTAAMLLLSLGKSSPDLRNSYVDLKNAWGKLKIEADTPRLNAEGKPGAFNEAKEARFGIVVLMLQGLFLWKLSSDADKEVDPKKREKIKAELLAAQLSVGASVLDLGATAIKGLAAAKDAAMSYQMLKVGGGLLSAGAAIISVKMSLAEAERAVDQGRVKLSLAYYLRSGTDAFAGGFSFLAALSYTAPAMKALSTRFPVSAVARFLSTSVARLYLWRAALLFFGIGFSLFSLVITLAIWYFSDNALQSWSDQCAFGKNKRFTTIKEQEDAFYEALKDVT
ncbi:T6SS effector BTH_I2691 family protein [Variovorax sp. YR752]|uniref:T6SS effector BTH_I2691 family protein n=1 Tax=Variovorax sp. YR752 TaxID=1884383 RepID=UPI0031382C9D